MRSHDLGVRGEDLASQYLLSRGYTILERNWRFQKAEIDILAAKDGTLAVVEVKTRSSKAFGDPEEFIGRHKIQHLKKAANAYVNMNRLNLDVRFDYIGIVMERSRHKISHLKDACFIF
jgi:putative endonuclease